MPLLLNILFDYLVANESILSMYIYLGIGILKNVKVGIHFFKTPKWMNFFTGIICTQPYYGKLHKYAARKTHDK